MHGDPMAWLTKALGLPDSEWWGQNMDRVPLLLEILQLMRETMPAQGSDASMPRNPKYLLPLQVRRRILWLQHDPQEPQCVILALLEYDNEDHEHADPDEVLAQHLNRQSATEDLQWFLQELTQDIEDMKAGSAEEPDTEDMKAGSAEEPAEETESVTTVPRAPGDTRAPEQEPVSAEDTDSDSEDPCIPTEPVVSNEEDNASFGDLIALAVELPVPESP